MIAGLLFTVALLVLGVSLRRRRGHTPTVEPRMSKESLIVCAQVARRYFEESAR